jgi:hypothetical protein
MLGGNRTHNQGLSHPTPLPLRLLALRHGRLSGTRTHNLSLVELSLPLDYQPDVSETI